MEKHVTLVGILNIVYRSFMLLWAFVLFFLAAFFGDLISLLIETDVIRPHEIPFPLLNIVPFILVAIAATMTIISIAGIIGGIGVLKQKEWGRIVMLVVSFINLLRIPLGTALGVYSIYILMHADVIKMFSTRPAPPPVAA